MNDDEILALFDACTALGTRVRAGQQPTQEIAALADETRAAVATRIGLRGWHEHQLDGVMRSFNWHRDSAARNPASITGLTLALNCIALMGAPMETVIETARGPADDVRVAALMEEIRRWR